MFEKLLIARARARIKKLEGKLTREDSKQREGLIRGIMEMSDMVEIYEDDECKVLATEKYLESQESSALLNIYKEMLDEAEKMLLGRD